MKNKLIRKRPVVISLLLVFIFSIFNVNVLFNVEEGKVAAATNLIKDGSFEDDIDEGWDVWAGEDANRGYSFARSLDTGFGLGSYSVVINATAGDPDSRWDAGLITKKDFSVESGATYFFVFNAKASSAGTKLSMFLENSTSYAGLTPGVEEELSTEWEKHTVMFSPTATADAWVTFAFGDMPNGGQIYLDGIQIFKSDINVRTTLLKGYIGDTNKYVQVSNMVNFDKEDVEIELPYYNNLTGEAERKRFTPEKVSSGGAYINFYAQTFSGAGKVFINGEELGAFDYRVQSKINDFYPSMVRADEDLVVYGIGFMPYVTNTYLVVKGITDTGNPTEKWISATSIDSTLTQAVFELPVGVIGGKMKIYTAYVNNAVEEVELTSSYVAYSVKPIIDHVEWSRDGYEQVGDKLKIYGKGMGAKPSVIFYDDEGNKVDTKSAKLVSMGEHEVVEVIATQAYNKFQIKVMSQGVESDDADAVNYSAKPKFDKITSSYKRLIQSTQTYIYAAKVGDKIRLSGSGLRPTTGEVSVEFQGVSERILAVVATEDISSKGSYVEVVVPEGAQNGHININANGEKSNYIPIEIVPTVVAINPDPIVPGEDILITANGVGSNINLAKVKFKLDNSNSKSVTPSSITYADGYATVRVKAPMALSNQSTKVTLEYDRWTDTGDSVLNVNPVITGASINMDNKILTIKGYGFSTYSKENEITYMYADEPKTVIKPSVRMLGVYPTAEGQEIRIKISDEYYYGYVKVKVGGLESAEANFGPASIVKIARRVEHVESLGDVRGVLYINGYNFGENGGVKVGEQWAEVHYRTNFFIIAVVNEQYLYDNPVIVTKE